MHIVYVTGNFAKSRHDTALGGMAKAVFFCAEGMKKRGHRVEIITADVCSKKWIYHGIEVISIPSSFDVDMNRIEMGLSIFEREIFYSKEIAKIDKEFPIDIIQYTGWFGVGLLHNEKIPAVMRISTYSKSQLVGAYSKKKVDFLGVLECLAARRMNAIYAPSNNAALALGNDIKRKIYVLETPYAEERLIEDEKLYYDKLSGKKYLLFFGRMSVDKGIDVIRDILYKLFQNNPDLYFVFAGENRSKKAELQKSAKEYKSRLIFLGMVSHEELFPIVRGAEVVVMPSIMDNFPNSCAEAMARGKIVIGTDGSSLEQFISDGVSGFLARINDSSSLLSKIQEALSLKNDRREAISQSAINRIEKLNPDNYYKKVECLYENVIAKCNVREQKEKHKY